MYLEDDPELHVKYLKKEVNEWRTRCWEAERELARLRAMSPERLRELQIETEERMQDTQARIVQILQKYESTKKSLTEIEAQRQAAEMITRELLVQAHIESHRRLWSRDVLTGVFVGIVASAMFQVFVVPWLQ